MSQLRIPDAGLRPVGRSNEGLQYQIRPMRHDDLPVVVEIDQESFTLPWPERAFHYELNENPLSMLWVAEVTGEPGSPQTQITPRIVGMVVIWLVIDEAHIATIAVQSAYRGQGIAGQLLAAALVGAIQRGMKSAILEVRAGNLPAQKLYRRFRFDVAGRRSRYYKDNGEDALLMTLNNMDQAYLDWLVNLGWQVEREDGS